MRNKIKVCGMTLCLAVAGSLFSPQAMAQDADASVSFVPFTEQDRSKSVPEDDSPLEAPVLEAPTIDTINNVAGLVSGDNRASGESSILPPDIDWEQRLQEINERISARQTQLSQQEEAARQEQLRADAEFRSNNSDILAQDDSATVRDGVVYPPSSPGGSVTRGSSVALPPDATAAERVVALARTQIGVPYVWGGTSPYVGLDCSGLTQWVYSQIGINIPRVTYDQINIGTPIYNQSDIKPGDLVFPHSGHVGIAISSTEMIHAPQPGQSVEVGSIYAFQQGVRIL